MSSKKGRSSLSFHALRPAWGYRGGGYTFISGCMTLRSAQLLSHETCSPRECGKAPGRASIACAPTTSLGDNEPEAQRSQSLDYQKQLIGRHKFTGRSPDQRVLIECTHRHAFVALGANTMVPAVYRHSDVAKGSVLLLAPSQRLLVAACRQASTEGGREGVGAGAGGARQLGEEAGGRRGGRGYEIAV